MARGMFEYDLASATEEQLKTTYWDYDSETGKRYSEDESGEESNNDETFDNKEEVNQSAGYTSSGHSSSTSSSGNFSEGSTKSYRKKRRTKKKSSSSVPLSTYMKEKEENSNHTDEKFDIIKEEMKRISSDSDMLKNRDKLNGEAVLELKNMMNNMKIIAKNNSEENNEIRSKLQDLIMVKNDSIDKNESNRKRAMEMNAKIERLSNLITAESEARELFSKSLEDRYLKLEAGVETIKNDSKNLHSEISKKTALLKLRKMNNYNKKLKWREVTHL